MGVPPVIFVDAQASHVSMKLIQLLPSRYAYDPDAVNPSSARRALRSFDARVS